MNANLQTEYRRLFDRLGFPLAARDGIPESKLDTAGRKAGIRLPDALRDYYVVAGRERTLNHSFNRLRFPGEWEVEAGKLVFMEENQVVVVWGVTASLRQAQDSRVFQGQFIDDGVNYWWPEHNKCSVFLKFMIHLQAAYGGGMPCTASAAAPSDFGDRIERDWEFIGEVNKMRAYSRTRQAVCVTEWPDLGGKTQSLRVFAGAQSKADLNLIAADLSLQWD